MLCGIAPFILFFVFISPMYVAVKPFFFGRNSSFEVEVLLRGWLTIFSISSFTDGSIISGGARLYGRLCAIVLIAGMSH